MTLARRAILKLIGGGAAALPSAARAAPVLLARAEPLIAAGAAVGALGQADGGPPQPLSPARKILGDTLFRQLENLRTQHDHEQWSAQSLRTDGLDPDLAALRSCSRAWKVRKQRERLQAEFTLSRRLQNTLWPPQ